MVLFLRGGWTWGSQTPGLSTSPQIPWVVSSLSHGVSRPLNILISGQRCAMYPSMCNVSSPLKDHWPFCWGLPSSFNKTKVISPLCCAAMPVRYLAREAGGAGMWRKAVNFGLHACYGIWSCLLSLISWFIISRKWWYLNVVLSNLLVMARMIFLCKY